ncbi:MAG: ATP synthase F1 subunit epsilon [Patescibacteria group bacterium]|nr:ATP synthase F1 subunit epsilon [Patescibacteria group bacterium]
MKTIKLKITTPERIVFEGEARQVTLPTQMGEITILPDHVPIISNIKAGIVEAQQEKKIVPMAISGGFLEFHGNELTILADTAERAEEIGLERAEKARKMAEKMKQDKQKNIDETQYASVVSQIEKQLARIKVVKKYTPRSKRGVVLENGNN